MHAGGVTAKTGLVRIGFEEGDSSEAGGQDMEAHDQLVIGNVIEAVAADDEVVGIGKVREIPH
jgi:hypothetical protein